MGRVFQTALRDRKEMRNCFAGGNVFIRWWVSGEKWFTPFKPFPKFKTTFCKYWILIKIKIRMTCVYREYKVKLKVVQEEWPHTAKNEVFIGFQHEIFYLVGNGEGLNEPFMGG